MERSCKIYTFPGLRFLEIPIADVVFGDDVLPFDFWGSVNHAVFWIEQGWLQASIACRGKRRSYTITPEALMSLHPRLSP
jgi:hypothetical protein